ncbi:MAG: hypothetical protein ABR499_14165 [Gemmatimonadaceae bacterium]
MLLVLVEDHPLDVGPHEARGVRAQSPLCGLAEPLVQQLDGVLPVGSRALLDAPAVEREADLPHVADLEDLPGPPRASRRARW